MITLFKYDTHKTLTSFTFVFVAFWFDAKDGHHHDDDDDGGRGQCDQEPGLAVERLRLEVPVFEESLRRSLNLETRNIKSI